MVGYLKGIYVSLIILSWNILSQSNDSNNTFTAINVPCTGPECHDYVSYVTNSMNRNANPCNDFYEYVCGRKQNPIPHYYPVWSTPVEMSMKSAKDIRRILEERLRADDNPGLQKAKNLYRTCMELPYVGMLTPVATQSYVQAAGYFPLLSESGSRSQIRKSWVDIHNYYFGLTSDSGLYEILSMGHNPNNFEPLIHLIEVYSPFGRIVFSKTMKSAQKKLYEKYLTAILSSVFSSSLLKVSPKVLASRIEAIVTFRCEIQAIKTLYPKAATVAHRYNLMTVSELEYWYKTMADVEGVIPIPWVEFVHSIYRQNKTEQVIKDMQINVSSKSYQKSLMHLIKKTPNEVIVNHMHLHFIEKHLEFNDLLKNILMETIVVKGKMTGRVKYLGYKWHTCILDNTMKEAIGKAYVQKYFPVSKKKRIEAFVTEIKDALLMQIRDSEWLGGFVMNKFKHVVDSMKIAIGYPEYYDDEYLRHGYHPIVEPGIAEASYCPRLNRLIVSAAIFQPPLYDARLPKTVLYGSAGALIAHELHHAFSPYAVAQCYNFTMPPSKKFLHKKKMDCFLKKYDKLPIKELNFLKPAPTIDGSRTLEENMSDAMGLKIAYEAFGTDGWANERCSILPMFRGTTCEQLFFISFAVVHCSDINPDRMFEEVLQEDHSADRVRVNAAVSNMKEFARIFNCPKKAPMNPVERCDLWK